MLEVIYISDNDRVLRKEYERHLIEMSGLPPKKLVFTHLYRHDVRDGFIPAEYTKGKGYSVFIDDTVRFIKKGWGAKILDSFKYGFDILGAVGFSVLDKNAEIRWVDSDGNLAPNLLGGIWEPETDNRYTFQELSPKWSQPEPATILDSRFVAVNNRILGQTEITLDNDFYFKALKGGMSIGVVHGMDISFDGFDTNTDFCTPDYVTRPNYPSEIGNEVEVLKFDEPDHSDVAFITPLGGSESRKRFFEGYSLPSIEGNFPSCSIIVKGYGSAPHKRNVGLAKAKELGYKYVVFSDDDIIYPYGFLNAMKKAIKGVSFAYCGYKGIVMQPETHHMGGNYTVYGTPFDAERLKKGNFISTMSMVKVSDLPEGGFDESLHRLQDYDLFLRMVLEGKVGRLAETEFMAFYNDKGITSKGTDLYTAAEIVWKKNGLQ